MQKQKMPGANSGDGTDVRTGNNAARMAAAKVANLLEEKPEAKAAVRASNTPRAIAPLPRDTAGVRAMLDGMKTLPVEKPGSEKHGMRGGVSIKEACALEPISYTSTVEQLAWLISHGEVTDQLLWKGSGRKICICLAITCRIGPFIPFKGK